MRKTEFTNSNGVSKSDSRYADKRGWLTFNQPFKTLLLVFSILLAAGQGQQAIAQCSLVCNDDVNVSLPGPAYDCEVAIEVDMVMENTSGCNSLIIDILDLQGEPIPTSPIVNTSHIGTTLIFRVTDDNTGNSCWGTLEVEDKLGPQILNCQNEEVYCLQDLAPQWFGGDAPSPSFDDCNGDPVVEYLDNLVMGTCNDDFTAEITRNWTATDIYGNQTFCTQLLTVKKMPIDDFVPMCPLNLDLECSASGQPSTEPEDTGFPQVVVGNDTLDIRPGGNFLCEMASSYQDEVFNICGGGLKILRTWNVYDWCLPTIPGQNPFTCIQIIKVKDGIAPTLNCPGNIVESSTSAGCSAYVYLPAAIVTDECSEVEVKILTPVGQVNGNGGNTPAPIPVGDHEVTYIATDECGNVSTCIVPLTVNDDTAPVAVCDEYTTVSLTGDGTASISAVVFDDGSSDNCGIDFFEVSRMASSCQTSGSPFMEFVDFDCCDIGEVVMVVMRIHDFNGNYNECMVEVQVQDKIDPTIICPPNKMVECSDPIPGVQAPTVDDNCAGATWIVNEENFVGSCGVGSIIRTFTVTDASGRTADCTQQITITNSSPFNLSDIVWPLDYTSYDCDPSLEPEDLGPSYNEPVTSNDACDMVAVTYTDQPLNTNPPACWKVLRKWIVIDWCQFNPNQPQNGGIWEHTQVLKVEDVSAPVLNCPSDMTLESSDANCNMAFVELDPITVTDCSNNFEYSYTIDYDSNGSTDKFGTSPNLSGQYPFGMHTVHFTVNDLCGNESTCTFTITIEDGKNPTPVCVNGIAVDLMEDQVTGGGIIELLPTMFDNGSFDNCTTSEDLTISITPSTFHCINLGTNIVTMWVTDEAGNSDFCETYVIIQDNMGLCNFSNANVAGAIETEEGIGVEDVMIEANSNGPATAPVLANTNGHYQFFDLETGHDYTFTPYLTEFPLNGVTTFDLVLITKHVLNTQALDSPYKLIAADVNNSGTVSTMDVVELRRMVLNVLTDFTNNTSWRFVEKSYVFPNPSNPFSTNFPEVYSANNLNADNMGVDFVAVKIGDVNGSAIPNFNSNSDDRNSNEKITFFAQEKTLTPGKLHSVSFEAKDFDKVLGYQFTLQFDPNALEFIELQPNTTLNMSESNFGFTMLEEGIITTSWHTNFDDSKGQTKNTQPHNNTDLFTLTFRANTKASWSELLQITSQYTEAEAYTNSDAAQNLSELQIMDVQLQFNDMPTTVGTSLTLHQNTPNPFSDITRIGFELPNADNVTITVFDMSGKVLKVISGNFTKGYHEIRLGKDDLRGSGVLYYQLETTSQTETKKMIKM